MTFEAACVASRKSMIIWLDGGAEHLTSTLVKRVCMRWEIMQKRRMRACLVYGCV